MYEKLLQMSWDDMMHSDYVFKSNVEKHVIQIFGSEFEDGDTSLILVYYNVYTNKPMLLIQRYNQEGIKICPPEIEGFTMTLVENTESDGEDTESDGESFTEVTYVLRSLQEALQS